MSRPRPIAILFASEAAANYPMAGIPAAARMLRDAPEHADVMVAVPGGWQPTERCLREAARLAPGVRWRAVDLSQVGEADWFALPDCDADGASWSADPPAAMDLPQLRSEARKIIAATGKPGDGIVSRHLNRPISQAMTRVFLRWSGARPWHATLLAGLTGVAMAASLFFGGEPGLIAGAVLFQLASIIDGVDGETARATFRTSARGAMFDSVTDAVTNLSFVAGVSYNLYASGHEAAGTAGAIGFALLATGSVLLAIQSRRDGGDFTFDALKTRMRQRPSRLRQWLIWMTMRDFYALAACIAILAGGAEILLFVFAIVAAGWFAVVCAMRIAARA